MKKMVMTQDVLDNYHEHHLHRSERFKQYLMCKLCMPLWRARRDGLAEYWQERLRPFFKGGQEVYVVTYPNGTVGYYHVLCVDRLRQMCSNQKLKERYPFYCMDLEEILRYDVDKWNTFNDFMKQLMENNKSDVKLVDSQIIAKIQTQFECSHTTAWRRLRDFRKNLP